MFLKILSPIFSYSLLGFLLFYVIRIFCQYANSASQDLSNRYLNGVFTLNCEKCYLRFSKKRQDF